MAGCVAYCAVSEDEEHEVENDAEAPEDDFFAGPRRQDEEDRGEEDQTCGWKGGEW